MKSNYNLERKDCVYIYVSKNLKREIEKHQDKLQKEENKKNGRKARHVTFSYASKNITKLIKGGRKWF